MWALMVLQVVYVLVILQYKFWQSSRTLNRGGVSVSVFRQRDGYSCLKRSSRVENSGGASDSVHRQRGGRSCWNRQVP